MRIETTINIDYLIKNVSTSIEARDSFFDSEEKIKFKLVLCDLYTKLNHVFADCCIMQCTSALNSLIFNIDVDNNLEFLIDETGFPLRGDLRTVKFSK